jgi:ribonuclease E
MVLESNRDLVLRRLVECLGRDRTRHQVAEVTSLGLVQMTRKRVGQGLLEAFSETCPECNGRGVKIHLHGAPAPAKGDARRGGDGGSSSRRRGSEKGDKAGKGDKADGKAAKAEKAEKAETLDTSEPTTESTEPTTESTEPLDTSEPTTESTEPATEPAADAG